jgi:hypothetical protein
MPRARYPAAPLVCAPCGPLWPQRDGTAPRTSCATTRRHDAEGMPARAPALPPDEPVLPIRSRRVQAHRVTVTCAWRHTEAEAPHVPGPLPRYAPRTAVRKPPGPAPPRACSGCLCAHLHLTAYLPHLALLARPVCPGHPAHQPVTI